MMTTQHPLIYTVLVNNPKTAWSDHTELT